MMCFKYVLLVLAVATLEGTSAEHSHAAPPAVTLPPWDYEDPAKWPGMCNSNHRRRQSPIDFTNASVEPVLGNYAVRFFGPCEFSAKTTAGIVHARHAFVVSDPELECGVTDPESKEQYTVNEMHFHTPAEHRIERGLNADFEVHIVTTSQADPSQKLVIAALFNSGSNDQGATTALLSALFQAPSSPRAHSVRGASPVDLLPTSGGALYSYEGSLTTPPCSENVRWYVVAAPLYVPARVTRALRTNMLESSGKPFVNNRPLQMTSSIQHVRLLNNGGYISWSLAVASRYVGRIVLVLLCVMILAAVGMVLYYQRVQAMEAADPADGSYADVPDGDDSEPTALRFDGKSEEMRTIERLSSPTSGPGGYMDTQPPTPAPSAVGHSGGADGEASPAPPQAASPERVQTPQAASPERVQTPQAASPERVQTPQAASPERVQTPQAASPERIGGGDVAAENEEEAEDQGSTVASLNATQNTETEAGAQEGGRRRKNRRRKGRRGNTADGGDA